MSFVEANSLHALFVNSIVTLAEPMRVCALFLTSNHAPFSVTSTVSPAICFYFIFLPMRGHCGVRSVSSRRSLRHHTARTMVLQAFPPMPRDPDTQCSRTMRSPTAVVIGLCGTRVIRRPPLFTVSSSFATAEHVTFTDGAYHRFCLQDRRVQ